MSVTSLQIPYGVRPVNPVAVDAWSGPYTGVPDTLQHAIDAANAAIPKQVRFQSMEVRLLVGGVSRKFWYRDGVEDVNLVEFSSGAVQNLVAGDGIAITTAPNGSVTITNTGGGGANGLVSTIVWQFMEIPTPLGDDVTFTLSKTPYPTTSLMFFVNGYLQMQGVSFDYTLSGVTVTMNNPVPVDAKIAATYSYQQAGESISWLEPVSGIVDGENAVFTLQHSPNPTDTLMFFYNGVLQKQGGDYTLNGHTVTMLVPAEPGSNLQASYTY